MGIKSWFFQRKIELLALVVGFGFVYGYATFRWNDKVEDPEDVFLTPPIPAMKNFTFGYNEVLADLYWLRLLQNIDHCGQPRRGNPFSPEGRRMGRNRTPECSKGWSYQMLDFIIDLAPQNQIPQLHGPPILSVVVDDIDGATALYEKTLVNFPNNWQMTFGAAYHQMAELEDLPKAAELFQRSADLGAPQWVPLLAARLNTKSGRVDIAKAILKKYLSDDKLDEDNRKRALEKLKDLENSQDK